MKKFLRHSWPIWILLLFEFSKVIIKFHLGLAEQIRVFKYVPSSTFFYSLVWIYYLKTSPFTKSQNSVLIVLIFLRLMAVNLSFDSVVLEGTLETGLEVLLIIFYFIRTKSKEKIRRADQAKLILFFLFFALSVSRFFVNKAYREVIKTNWDLNSLWDWLNMLDVATFIVAVAFVSIHIIMLYKLSDHYQEESHDQKIDQIGK